MRSIVDTVDRPITLFRCTKEFITAIVMLNAKREHRVAVTRAGVLHMHRDISTGDILIVDNPDDPNDFDYSSMSRDVSDSSCSSLTGAAVEEELVADADAGVVLKERTETLLFMAITRLCDSDHGVHHDLESFYWVFVWVVARHVARCHLSQDKLCSPDYKVLWLTLMAKGDLVIPGTPSLTELLRKLTVIIRDQVFNEDLDYDALLAPFVDSEVLARDD